MDWELSLQYSFKMKKSRHAAMEMSVGTMVTIVLLMIVLVLGIFFIQRIFSSGTNAIDSIDSQVQAEIQKLFAEEGKPIAVYPTSRDVIIKRGDDPKGFAFSVKNDDAGGTAFTYTVTATDVSNCGGSLTQEMANSYLIGGSGSFNLGQGNTLDLPRLVRLDVPESAPVCTIIYNLDVQRDGPFSTADIFVTFK
jgi:hypothetical protein